MDLVRAGRCAVLVAALCVSFLAGGLALHRAEAAGQKTPDYFVPDKAASGRWQVVNGTPEISANIMLLDSQTGETWVNCSGSDGERTWCYMPRSMSTATAGTFKK